MAILQLPLPIAANTGVTPNLKMMKVTDDLTTITAAGYLKFSDLQGYDLSPEDEIHVKYNASETDDNAGDLAVLKVQINNGVITLEQDLSEGNVELPVSVDHVAVYASTDGVIKDDPAIAINAGSFQAGLDGTQGKYILYPSGTDKGRAEIECSENTNQAVATVLVDPIEANTTFHLPSPVVSSNLYIQVSDKSAGLASDLQAFRVTASWDDLIAGGFNTLVTAGVGVTFEILELNISSDGTDFSGGGGDRNLQFTDGTSIYSIIPAANLQSLPNARWGDTALPFPVTAGIGTPTVSGENLIVQYQGGSADYTAGDIVISGLLHQLS